MGRRQGGEWVYGNMLCGRGEQRRGGVDEGPRGVGLRGGRQTISEETGRGVGQGSGIRRRYSTGQRAGLGDGEELGDAVQGHGRQSVRPARGRSRAGRGWLNPEE